MLNGGGRGDGAQTQVIRRQEMIPSLDGLWALKTRKRCLQYVTFAKIQTIRRSDSQGLDVPESARRRGFWSAPSPILHIRNIAKSPVFTAIYRDRPEKFARRFAARQAAKMIAHRASFARNPAARCPNKMLSERRASCNLIVTLIDLQFAKVGDLRESRRLR